MRRAIFLGIIVMGLLASSCDWFIESQIFFPTRDQAGTPQDHGIAFEDLEIMASDGVRLHAWWCPAPDARAVFLFFHGNAGNITHRLDNIVRLYHLGLSVLILDYRGYGKSQGRISEKGLYLDAAAALKEAAKRAREAGLPLVIFGRSLGGVAAVSVAGDPEVDGVILESTFTNLGAMAASIYPLPGLRSGLASRFNSRAMIQKLTAPVLFFHGDADEIVPFALGQELYEACPAPKEFVALRGAGHNDTYLKAGRPYWDKLDNFIAGLKP